MGNNLINKFLIFEEKNNLFNTKIANVNFWPIIRFNLYSQLYQKINGTQINHPKKRKIISIILIVKYFYLSLLKSPFFRKRKSVIIFNHSRRIKNKNGYYECKYTEHLANEDSFVFEAPFLDQHYTPVQTKNVVYLDLVLNISRSISLFAHFKKISATDYKTLNKLQKSIEKEFNISIPNFKNFVLKAIFKHQSILYLSKIILKQIKPTKIIMVVAYSDLNMPFVEQAKKMGIKVIEQQHGIMGKTHIGYNFLAKQNFNWFPDEIWVWNKFWVENTRFPIGTANISIKGFPYLDKFKKNKNKNNSKKQILFVSQGPFSDRLFDLAIKLSIIIDHQAYQLLFKLHPSEYEANKNKFNLLNKKNIIVLTDNNIYEVFNETYCQVGVNSTALFEGIEFGLKTFIFKITGWEVFENDENVIFVNNEKDILENL